MLYNTINKVLEAEVAPEEVEPGPCEELDVLDFLLGLEKRPSSPLFFFAEFSLSLISVQSDAF